MSTYIDLLIENDDIVTDDDGQPLLITDRDVIAQDINHAIRESGLLSDLIGERNQQRRAMIRKKLRTVVENDSRVTPGTSSVSETLSSTKEIYLVITAETEFGLITIGAN
jgi:hypothetical protein